MQSYKKLADMRDETIFILKTKKKHLEKLLHRENGSVDTTIAYALAQLQELLELYEIK